MLNSSLEKSLADGFILAIQIVSHVVDYNKSWMTSIGFTFRRADYVSVTVTNIKKPNILK